MVKGALNITQKGLFWDQELHTAYMRQDSVRSCRSSISIRLRLFMIDAEILWSALRSRILVRSLSRRSAFTFLSREANNPFFARDTAHCARLSGYRSMRMAGTDSPVETAEVSESAKAKADTKCTPDGLPVHNFTTLLSDLATVTLPGSPDYAFPLMAKPTELQWRAFELLEIDSAKDVAM